MRAFIAERPRQRCHTLVRSPFEQLGRTNPEGRRGERIEKLQHARRLFLAGNVGQRASVSGHRPRDDIRNPSRPLLTPSPGRRFGYILDPPLARRLQKRCRHQRIGRRRRRRGARWHCICPGTPRCGRALRVIRRGQPAKGHKPGHGNGTAGGADHRSSKLRSRRSHGMKSGWFSWGTTGCFPSAPPPSSGDRARGRSGSRPAG